MTGKPYDIAVVLGRFQPLHIGHINLIKQSLTLAKKVFVMIGHSGFQDIRHFIEPEEVETIIRNTFYVDRENLHIEHIADMHDDGKWVLKLANKIDYMRIKHFPSERYSNICFLGSKKDINWYANLLPNWTLITLPPYKNITATKIRGSYFCNTIIDEEVASESKIFMRDFLEKEEFKKLSKRYKQYYSIID